MQPHLTVAVPVEGIDMFELEYVVKRAILSTADCDVPVIVSDQRRVWGNDQLAVTPSSEIDPTVSGPTYWVDASRVKSIPDAVAKRIAVMVQLMHGEHIDIGTLRRETAAS
jgi:hypothetical protein